MQQEGQKSNFLMRPFYRSKYFWRGDRYVMNLEDPSGI
jgi:hypothetical protein